jgi:hypothetical protein
MTSQRWRPTRVDAGPAVGRLRGLSRSSRPTQRPFRCQAPTRPNKPVPSNSRLGASETEAPGAVGPDTVSVETPFMMKLTGPAWADAEVTSKPSTDPTAQTPGIVLNVPPAPRQPIARASEARIALITFPKPVSTMPLPWAKLSRVIVRNIKSNTPLVSDINCRLSARATADGIEPIAIKEQITSTQILNTGFSPKKGHDGRGDLRNAVAISLPMWVCSEQRTSPPRFVQTVQAIAHSRRVLRELTRNFCTYCQEDMLSFGISARAGRSSPGGRDLRGRTKRRLVKRI